MRALEAAVFERKVVQDRCRTRPGTTPQADLYYRNETLAPYCHRRRSVGIATAEDVGARVEEGAECSASGGSCELATKEKRPIRGGSQGATTVPMWYHRTYQERHLNILLAVCTASN